MMNSNDHYVYQLQNKFSVGELGALIKKKAKSFLKVIFMNLLVIVFL